MNVAIFCDVSPCSPNMRHRSSEMSVHVLTTRRYIPENGNIQIHIVLFLRGWDVNYACLRGRICHKYSFTSEFVVRWNVIIYQFAFCLPLSL
jgi:hypothetical protein